MSYETDHYVHSAEMYDLLSEAHWTSRQDSMRNTLRQFAHLRGTVLDIGAGTGACLQLIAENIPDVDIYAIEPSASMRIGLMTRILLTPGLRKRVTVCAKTFQDAWLPERLDAVIACGCIGYFNQDERIDLWHRLAAHLNDGGRVLTDVMTLDRPQTVDEMNIASTEIGKFQYDIWLSGNPAEDDIMLWHMRFEVRNGNHIVRTFSIEREWHTFGLDQLVQEAATCGFRAEPDKDSPVPTVILQLAT